MSEQRPEPAEIEEPPSPCIGVCRLDRPGGCCRGCGRTLEEIARWRDAPAAEKRAILARSAVRRRATPEP